MPGPVNHKLRYTTGSDPRNYVVRCKCGWSYSGTYRAVHKRGPMHVEIFANEPLRWNDKGRQAEMPQVWY